MNWIHWEPQNFTEIISTYVDAAGGLRSSNTVHGTVRKEKKGKGGKKRQINYNGEAKRGGSHVNDDIIKCNLFRIRPQ